MFYYILGNFKPELRSSLQAVQILAIAKANDFHSLGWETLIRPFVEKMKLLSRVRVMIVPVVVHNTSTTPTQYIMKVTYSIVTSIIIYTLQKEFGYILTTVLVISVPSMQDGDSCNRLRLIHNE